MSNEDVDENVPDNTVDTFIPTIPNGTKIRFDGNPATIDGVLHSVAEHFESNNIFQPLLKHNMVVLSNGRLAVDSISAVSFLDSAVSDSYTLILLGAAPRAIVRVLRRAGGALSRRATMPMNLMKKVRGRRRRG